MHKPVARQKGLLVSNSGDEVVIFDQENNRIHRLNRTSAVVWQASDGTRSVTDLARHVESTVGASGGQDLVALALGGLARARLLEDGGGPHKIHRREAIRRLGSIGVATMLVPVVSTILAPSPADAATVPPCGALGTACVVNGDCCSGSCVATFCN